MRLLDISPYSIYPPKGGGSARVYNMLFNLSKYIEINHFSQIRGKETIKFPLKPVYHEINQNFQSTACADWITITAHFLSIKIGIHRDLYLNEILNLINPKLIKEKLLEAHIVQVEHPFQFSWVNENKMKKTPIIYSSHNVEYDIIRQSTKLPKPLSKKIINNILEKERKAVEQSDAVIVVSKEDKDSYHNMFNINEEKIFVIPNCVDLSNISPPTKNEKELLKVQYGFKSKKIAIFVGSDWPPNIDAVRNIFEFSAQLKNNDLIFLIVGSVGKYFKSKGNVFVTGFVQDVTPYLKMSDMALNPMSEGSGTNIKLLEYLAYKLPTISTGFGCRGIEAKNGKDVIISELSEFYKKILELLEIENLNEIGENGFKVVEEKYNWEKNAEELIKIYRKLIENK